MSGLEGIHQAACQQAGSKLQPPEFKIIHSELLEFHLWFCAFRQFTLLVMNRRFSGSGSPQCFLIKQKPCFYCNYMHFWIPV